MADVVAFEKPTREPRHHEITLTERLPLVPQPPQPAQEAKEKTDEGGDD